MNQDGVSESVTARNTLRVPKAVRYLVSGGTGAVVNIGTLFVCTHLFGVWYLVSATLAFLTAFGVSFVLQRSWTFERSGTERLMRHTVLYFAVAAVNTGINALLVYGLVEYGGVWYITAQILSGIAIAAGSFFVYRKIFV